MKFSGSGVEDAKWFRDNLSTRSPSQQHQLLKQFIRLTMERELALPISYPFQLYVNAMSFNV